MLYSGVDYLHKEIGLRMADIETICHSGSNDQAVKMVCLQSYVIEQFKDISDSDLIRVANCLADGSDINDRSNAIEFIIWVVAWSIFDESFVD